MIRPRTTAALVVAALLAGLAAAPAAPAAPGASRAEPTPEEAAQAAGACPGAQVAVVVDGAALCTHGEDVAPQLESTESPLPPEESPGPVVTNRCHGDGVSGPRVQLLYVHRPGVNNFAAYKPMMRERAWVIEEVMDASAGQVGGARRHVRFVTKPDCSIDIRRIELQGSSIAQGLARLGYRSPNRKYLIWVDSGEALGGYCSGLGTVMYDDQPGPTNANDHYPGYAMMDISCLADWFDGQVEAHELMHTLGSVLDSAPRSTRAGHCRDDHDVMCYEDGGLPQLPTLPCPNEADELRFDCNKNDYFNPRPTGSNYLVNHWNTANSRFLTTKLGRAPTLTLPGAPTATAAGGYLSAQIAWTPPASSGGSRITGYRIHRDGALIMTVGGWERTFSDASRLTGGRSYRYTVTAVSRVGDGPPSAPVDVVPTGKHASVYVWAEESQVAAGATVQFTVVVENDGEEPLANVAVSGPRVPDCARSLGQMVVFGNREYTCTYRTTTADRGTLTVIATVAASGMDAVESYPVFVEVT